MLGQYFKEGFFEGGEDFAGLEKSLGVAVDDGLQSHFDGFVFNAVPAGPVAQQIEVLQPVFGILLPECCVVRGLWDFLVKVDEQQAAEFFFQLFLLQCKFVIGGKGFSLVINEGGAALAQQLGDFFPCFLCLLGIIGDLVQEVVDNQTGFADLGNVLPVAVSVVP